MPQAISDNLKNSLNRNTPVYTKTILLYRQAWSGSAYAYDTAEDITAYLTDDSPGTIMWKLDKEDYGVFNLDNVTLTFRNDRNQWKQDNPKGLFPSGKLLNQSKIVINIGAQLADGTYSTLRSFTGYISGDPDYNPEEKTVSMTLVSAMSIFDKKSAEEISTPVTNEAHAYSAPDVFAYNTANNGVAAVRLVVKRGATADGAGAATEIKPTTGYEISNQNKKDLPLTVTLVTALTATESIWITYIYWHQDKLLEWLAEQIMTLCGISLYSISQAIFSSDVENTWGFNTQTDWDTCVKENVDTKITSGSFKIGILDDFTGDGTINAIWETTLGSWSISGSELYPSSSAYIRTALDKDVGTWQFKINHGSMSDYEQFEFVFVSSNGVWGTGTGYRLEVMQGPTYQRYYLYRDNGGTTTLLASYLTALNNSAHYIKITRNSSGETAVYIDDVLRISVTDNTYTASTYLLLANAGPYDGSAVYSITDIYFWEYGTTPGTGVMSSPVKDTGGSLSAWGNLIATNTANGATITIETYSSDSSDFSTGNDVDWITIGGTGLIRSALKRYLKWRVTAVLGSLAIPVTPIFDEISIKYYTSSTVIDLVNLTGMTCRQVLDLITEMPAYEMGIKSDDSYLYRSRITGVSAILDLRSDTNIKTVHNLSDGIDRVYNRVVAEFGIYRAIADASADTEPNSITKYGTREYSVSASNLLPAENVNLAYAVAPTILAYTKNPRRRCTIETKFILHLELGDKVTVYYDEPTALRQWHYDDTDVAYDQPDLEYYEDEDVPLRLNLWGVVMRVEGVEFNFQDWSTSFDLVEVLS